MPMLSFGRYRSIFENTCKGLRVSSMIPEAVEALPRAASRIGPANGYQNDDPDPGPGGLIKPDPPGRRHRCLIRFGLILRVGRRCRVRIPGDTIEGLTETLVNIGGHREARGSMIFKCLFGTIFALRYIRGKNR